MLAVAALPAVALFFGVLRMPESLLLAGLFHSPAVGVSSCRRLAVQ